LALKVVIWALLIDVIGLKMALESEIGNYECNPVLFYEFGGKSICGILPFLIFKP
jgi:hypothetical protein